MKKALLLSNIRKQKNKYSRRKNSKIIKVLEGFLMERLAKLLIDVYSSAYVSVFTALHKRPGAI